MCPFKALRPAAIVAAGIEIDTDALEPCEAAEVAALSRIAWDAGQCMDAFVPVDADVKGAGPSAAATDDVQLAAFQLVLLADVVQKLPRIALRDLLVLAAIGLDRRYDHPPA